MNKATNKLLESCINSAVQEAFSSLPEKLVLPDFKSYAQQVAAAYTAAPSFDSKAVPAWNALIAHTEKVLFPKIDAQVKKIYKAKNPEYATNPDGGGVQVVNFHPYNDAKEMTDEVMNKGAFRVSSADSEHPLWSVEQNVKFRAVHDWYTHIINKSSFSLRGELRAYNAHAKLLPPAAVPAAFTEIVGQACTAIVNGGAFSEQKICLLPQFDYYNVGKVKEPQPSEKDGAVTPVR